ncbi:MAG: hypothetical protein JSU57_04795 [Candidatus Heimdallarchaeota archaeon]|nr:MAG: hypothetical protein JSU57_04795 [Candidatus Heimdallarchaeota archaeon]
MPITKINALIKMIGSIEDVEIIHAAIDPDNLSAPPMTFNSVCVGQSLIITIKNVKNTETMLATVIDLLSAFQLTDNILKLRSSL